MIRTVESTNTVVLVSLVFVSLMLTGCPVDYTPIRPAEETPSTLSREEEGILIDRGESLLSELELEDLDGLQKTTKSIADVRRDKVAAVEANKFAPDELLQTGWIEQVELPLEHWEVFYRRNEPIGYSHRVYRQSKAAGENRIVIDVDSTIQSNQGESVLLTNTNCMIVESMNGGLKSIDNKIQQDSSASTISVVAASDIVRVTGSLQGVAMNKTLPRDLRLRGPFAVDESLYHAPMQAGETRRLQIVDPTAGEVINVELLGRGNARVPIVTGEYLDLMEVEQRVMRGEQVLASTLWCDDKGRIQKRFLGIGGITSYATDKDLALSIRSGLILRNSKKKSIELSSKIDTKVPPSSIVFRVTSSHSDPYQLVRGNAWQLVTSVSPLSCDVEVRPKDTELLLSRNSAASQADAEFMTKSSYVDFDHEVIVALKNELIDSTSAIPTPLQIAVGLQKRLNFGELTFQLTPASQTAVSKETDIVGGAVLACALARSVGVPARVATGLTYRDDPLQPQMIFHAWTEVFHDGNWLPIDSSQPDGKLPPVSIWLAASAMNDGNPLQPMVAAFEAIEKLDLMIRD